MKNSIWYLLLFLPIAVLAGVMLRYHNMTKFTKVEVAVQGYDPKDFFSGYYMYLRLDWKNTDCGQFADGICPEKDFRNAYTFYIKREQSEKLTEKVNAGKVTLQFSYQHEFEPIITDLFVDGKSFMDFVKEQE